jgi:ribosomal protein L31E
MKKINVGFRSKKSKSLLIAAIALTAVIATGNCQFASAAVATDTSVAQNTSENSVSEKENYSIPEKSKIVIGKTAEDKKIKVTLADCYADTHMLMFTTHLDSTERDDYAQELNPNVYINNKLLDRGTNHFKYDYIHNDDGTCNIVTRIYLDNVDTSQNLNVVVDYNKIGVTSTSDIDSNVIGNWKFDFVINASQIDKPILAKDINQTLTIDGHELYVHNIKIFPCRIEFTKGSDIDSFSDTTDIVSWQLKDDKGNMLKCSDGHGSAKSQMNNYFVDTTEIKSITIIPETSFNNADIAYPRTFPTTINYDKAITINIR